MRNLEDVIRGHRLKRNIYEDACRELSKEEIDKVLAPFINIKYSCSDKEWEQHLKDEEENAKEYFESLKEKLI